MLLPNVDLAGLARRWSAHRGVTSVGSPAVIVKRWASPATTTTVAQTASPVRVLVYVVTAPTPTPVHPLPVTRCLAVR